ncbi:MAG: ATP-binding domain-containing protein, partial [Candidatus Gracilibacteria bacterium]|nr:ATP-binding domain-containing protein [Candidatus Gracilibacteria bacterium]
PDDRIEAKSITNIIKEKGGQYSDNLILYRTNSQSRNLEEALMIAGIPYRVVGGLKFYDRMEVKDLLAYLKVILNPNDAVGIKRIINTPSRKIGATTIKKLDDYKNNFGVSYIQILENIEEVDELNSGAKRAISGFYEILIDLMETSKRLEVSDLIDYIIKKIGYEEYLKDDSTPDEFEARMENIKELKNVASTYNGMDPRDSLNQFLEEVALLTDLDNKDKELQDVVTLMTIHTSKGLEYNRVFITGLEEGLFPSSRSMNEVHELEEERRLMYVAMTRAKKELFLSRAQERFQYGDYVRNPESRFLAEISGDFIQNYDMGGFTSNNIFGNTSYQIQEHVRTPNFKVKKNIVENDVGEFSVGDKLSHPKFGIGFITSKTGDLAEIAFAGHGIKKMNIKIAPVKKI